MVYAVLEIFGWLTNRRIGKETVNKSEKQKKRDKKEVVDAVVIEDKTEKKKNSKAK